MMNQNSLKKKTIIGLFWSFSDLLANQGVKFAIQIILARLLLPEDFGTIGMITIFISLSQSIMDCGFTNALIREQNSTQEDYSTVFYCNLTMSITIYILLFCGSPYIGQFFNEPKLVSILRVLGVVVIINAFGLIQRTMLIKKIDFKTQTLISLISSMVSGFAAIIMAYLGFGVWSLVFQTLIMQIIQSIFLVLINRWIPSLVFSISSFKRLFGFGWKLLISGLIDTLYNNLYYIVIGKSFSAIQLGYYTNAQKLRDTATQSITSAVQKVSYPVLSNMQESDAELKYGFKRIIKNSVFIVFPFIIGMAAIAEPLIKFMFGEQWINSIYYFQVLCFSALLFPLHAINLNVLQVKGMSNLYLKIEIIKKCIGVLLILITLYLKLGIVGLLWASVINSYISYFINSYYSANIISYSTLDQIKDIFPNFVVSIIMGLGTYFIGLIIPYNNFVKLIIQISTGIVLYIVLCKVAKIKELDTNYNLIKRLINKKNVGVN